MKKVKIVLCGVMMMCLLAACGRKEVPTAAAIPAAEAADAAVPEEPALEEPEPEPRPSLDSVIEEVLSYVENENMVAGDNIIDIITELYEIGGENDRMTLIAYLFSYAIVGIFQLYLSHRKELLW